MEFDTMDILCKQEVQDHLKYQITQKLRDKLVVVTALKNVLHVCFFGTHIRELQEIPFRLQEIFWEAVFTKGEYFATID